MTTSSTDWEIVRQELQAVAMKLLREQGIRIEQVKWTWVDQQPAYDLAEWVHVDEVTRKQ